MTEAHDPRYLRGIDHFNAGEYFEAHEVWEDLWIETNDEPKGFYHGLIQAAVALHHAGRGNAAGAQTLYRRMRANLDPYAPRYAGLHIGGFLEAMERVIRPMFEDPPRAIDPEFAPHIALTASSD